MTADGNPITPETIVLGVLAPLTGDNAPDGQARVRAVRLAYDEFLQFAVGIPSGPGTKARSLALVVCDQVADAVSAATHLAEKVKVPAIIGPGFSGTTMQVAKRVSIANGVLIVSPSATTPDLTSLDDEGLVWRTSSSFEPESRAYADLLAQMEADVGVRTALGLSLGAPMRVAVLAKGDSYGKGLAEMLSSTLRFNGTSAAGNAGNFARFDLPDLTANPNADTTPPVTGIAGDFRPHVVLVAGTAEVITRAVGPIEAAWPVGDGAPARPFYVVSEGAKLSELLALVRSSEAGSPDRRLQSRVRVFGPRYDEELLRAFDSRYRGAYHEPLPDWYGVTGSYDAFYLIAYALAATQTMPLEGKSIAEGLKRLVPPALRIPAGPSSVSKAMEELNAGRNIDYQGVTGPLDFNPNTGEALGDYNLYCVQPTGFVFSGQYYDSTNSKLVGNFGACP